VTVRNLSREATRAVVACEHAAGLVTAKIQGLVTAEIQQNPMV
jgi:hypothetical protein